MQDVSISCSQRRPYSEEWLMTNSLKTIRPFVLCSPAANWICIRIWYCVIYEVIVQSFILTHIQIRMNSLFFFFFPLNWMVLTKPIGIDLQENTRTLLFFLLICSFWSIIKSIIKEKNNTRPQLLNHISFHFFSFYLHFVHEYIKISLTTLACFLIFIIFCAVNILFHSI